MTDHGPVLGVDVGGTFTDVALVADGTMRTAKVPTTADQSEGVLAAVGRVCEEAAIDPSEIAQFRHGTTVATNAILEGAAAETALVTTEGFGDVLEIGRQDRPALYDLDATKPDPLVPAKRRFEVAERATSEGIETPLETESLDWLVDALASAESVAISFLHSYASPQNEQRLATELQAKLDIPVLTSHETLPEFREYERTATTVVDAAVTPIVDQYLDNLFARLDGQQFTEPEIVQSNGGVATPAAVRDRAVTTVLSGPAAGVVGGAIFEPEDMTGVVTFDMGGTSSDVGVVRDGTIERTTEATIAGHPVHVPMVDIETVGAGGGSIAWVDSGGALRVGPRSAGADPGPVCYGRGGAEPTVTDAALVLGYLGDDTTLGDHTATGRDTTLGDHTGTGDDTTLGDDTGTGDDTTLGDDTRPSAPLSLDADLAQDALVTLAQEADLDGPVAAARGVYRVANATMTRAIRRVTLERGYDPREFALVACGGAGPMHACSLASRLGISEVRVPPASGVLSALGAVAADERHDASRTHRVALEDATMEQISDQYDQLTSRVSERLSDDERADFSYEADLRYVGQTHELTVPVHQQIDLSRLAERFHRVHDRRRGYRLADRVELLTLRVTGQIPSAAPPLDQSGGEADPVTHREVVFGAAVRETPVFHRGDLPAGTTQTGPAILAGTESTVVLPPEWRLTVDGRGTLQMEAAT